MRALLAALLLTACATAAPEGTPAQRAAGCWIDRNSAGGAVTMRWLPDAARSGALRGVRNSYGASGTTRSEEYRLEQRDNAWIMCQIEVAGERCWQVAEGQGGSLEGGRAFIDTYGDRLRISVVDAGGERLVYHGARDGCD
jgi:hypothetical protein